MQKTYNPKEMEDKLYQKWVEKNYFHAEVDHTRIPYTIVIPPPNITGQLHMGHALDNTIQDILIRFKRMQGFNALWQPGTDHASIATELKIMEKLAGEGTSKEELGREKFLERAWKWKEEYGGQIVNQLKKLGSSCDWERERFTMDDGCNKAVINVFCKMYEEGLIYKGNRMINWCPVCNTSISDAEVEHEEKNAHLWHMKYPLIENDGTVSSETFLTFVTSRPETILGDTAVAVNPNDDRYRHLVGRKVLIPLLGRAIPVVADDYVDIEFGTGVVKITPAHDPNDFEVAKRNNLPEINVLNDDATINENGGPFAGMTREAARKAIVKDFDERGLLVKVEDYTHNVGTHDRCDTIIEPMVKSQWFVRMDKLIKPAINAVKTGEIRLIPERMDKLYYNWTDNIRDWCISRQLWWGHRIPAYYCLDCGEITISKTAVRSCPKCQSEKIEQDPDTLDTWFSSALWPFSTLGWPEKTDDLKYFYPTNVLVTSYDIIFFWVIRMIFSGYAHMGEKPFNTVFLHGLIRDSQGKKMSKSSGNGIDPLEIIEQYGADALRFALLSGSSPDHDMRFHIEKVEASRNFANKIWNAARFILMKLENEAGTDGKLTESVNASAGQTATEPINAPLEPVDKWILHKMNQLVKEVTDHLENFDLGIAVQKIYDFVWDEYCDWYIEMVKPGGENFRPGARFTLIHVFTTALKLLHPFMPFITEEIFLSLNSATCESALNLDEESIMISKWPEYNQDFDFAKEEKEVEIIKEAVRGIRNIRAEMQVPPGKPLEIYVVCEKTENAETFIRGLEFFAALARAGKVNIQADKEGIPADAVSQVTSGAVIYIALTELVNIDNEIERLNKEAKRLDDEINRVETMLKNPRFMEKAPAEKIAAEREKQEKFIQMKEQVKIRLQQLVDLR
ncbi:MAG: valine--tRNA ligase [Lachnospiraceae bacterium]|nr:valine--tRNA ligase [Lachnospiraceae bacterium]